MDKDAPPLDLEAIVLRVVAAELYRTGTLPLYRATRLSRLSRDEFVEYCRSLDIEVEHADETTPSETEDVRG